MVRIDRVPHRNERLDFMSRLVSPAGTKGLPAGRKKPQTLLSRMDPQTGTKGLKEPRKKTLFVPAPDWAGTEGLDENSVFY
jgi:hypothetical protein